MGLCNSFYCGNPSLPGVLYSETVVHYYTTHLLLLQKYQHTDTSIFVVLIFNAYCNSVMLAQSISSTVKIHLLI